MENNEINLIKQIEIAFNKPKEFGIYHGVRKFKHGQLCKNVWFQHSYKNNANIACESDLEKKLCIYTEFEPKIIAYRSQPLKMTFEDFSYTPDFVVKLDSGLYIIREAKHSSQAESHHYQERFKKIDEHCNRFGVAFEVFTEKDLAQKVTQQHNFIYHCIRGLKIAHHELHECFCALSNYPNLNTNIGNLQRLVESLGFEKAIIFPMIVKGLLDIDFNSNITKTSAISLMVGGIK